MKCRIDKRGKQVFTPQNERSKLFDKLHNITGDFQKALDVFGITETNGFKEFKNRLRPINKLNSTDPIVFQSVLERLQQSGLSDNIFQLNTEQLNQKLIELGVSAEVRNQIQVWHGSPHLFQKFSTQFMGSGEGAQAFGWGLYFTDLKGIAENYANELSSIANEDLLNGEGEELLRHAVINNITDKSKDEILESYYTSYPIRRPLEEKEESEIYGEDYEDVIAYRRLQEEVLTNRKDEKFNTGRNVYNVTLHQGKQPSEYNWLEWDRPINNRLNQLLLNNVSQSSLSGEIHNIKPSERFDADSFDGGLTYRVGDTTKMGQSDEFTNTIYNTLEEAEEEARRLNFLDTDISGKDLYESLAKEFGQKQASLFLLENGIDGVKYPAESISRGATSDNARGFNYVVFDENAVTIEETIQFQKEGITLIPNGFVITEDGKRNIYLNSDNLNLDTLLHENGHLFLDTLKQRFPEHYQAGLELLTKNSVEAQPYIDYVNATQPNLKPYSEAWKEEVLAQIIGNKGEQLIKSRKKNTIKQWLEDLWSFIGEQFGLTSYTPSEIAEMTLEEFAEAVNVEMLNNNTINNEETRVTELGETGRDRRRWNPSRGNQTLEGAPINTKRKNVTGADPELTYWAEEYAKRAGIDYKRQSKYVEVDVDRATRIAEAYDAMEHAPQDPIVKEAYQNLINQTIAQYNILVEGGYQFYFFDETNDPYNGNPMAAMEELRNEKRMGSFATEAGFGTGNEGLDVSDNPLLQDTGLTWGWGSVDGEPKRVLANDLFRAVHDAFGHGLEGAGFRARGEENAWQAHARLFTGSAVAAITSETRGQNSWLNFGKYGEQNRTAKVEDTVFAPQKTGLMPEWTWQEGFDEGVESMGVEMLGDTNDQVSKAFNEGVEAVAKLANEYKKEFEIDSVQHNKVDKLFPAVSKMISEAYEQAETGMTTEEVKEAYKALEEETLQQYKFIVGKGLKVSRWTGEGEPYPNSKSMLKDVRENNHLYFLPNSEAFGKEGDEVDGRAGLKMTDVYLEDGYRMTLSEVFRVVHDYFGHGILGNQFGAVGEENATLQHLDLYSIKALPAVIFQTRGQNSWVNFSGVNDEALRKIREGSKTNNKSLLEEGQKEFRFATPKDSILPKIFNFKTYETARRINEQEEIRKSETYLDPRGKNEDTNISELLTRLTSRNSGKLNGFSRRSLGVSKRLGGYDVDVIAEYEGNQGIESLIKNIFPEFKGTQKIYEISNGEVYREMMIEALKTNKFKSSVTVHSAEDFSNMRLFVTEDGSTGITLTKDGFLGGAFGNPKADRPNNLAQMMLLGIKEGAITAEAFDTILPDYYSKFGFKAVSRTAFNEEYRPLKENGALEDWDYDTYSKFNNGRPDVVFFIYDGGDRGSIQNRIGQFDDYKNYQKHFTEYYDKDSYDDAYRFMEVEAINKNNYQSQEVNATDNVGTIDSANSDIRFQIDYQNFQNNNLRSHMFIENNSKLGSIRTKPTQRGEKVDSAIVYEAYRGQGVGTELYLETVRNLMVEGKILESDNSQTAPAKRIWEKLVEWGLAIKTGESNFESVPAPSWMTTETTIDEVINNQPIDRSEPSLQELMTYINFQGEANVTKTEVIELMQANEILDSHELLERLSRAEEQGIFIFTLERLKQTGLFENYEAHKVLESKERQGKIKDTLKWLRQNDNFEIQPTQLEKGGSLLSTGKIERQAEESEVTIQDLEGNQIKSNIRLSETITFDYNETLSNNIAFLNQIVRETTWDNLSSQVKDILNSIEVSALDNGIDLRGLSEKYHSATREDILGFLNSLESTLEGSVGPQEFEANRNEFLNFDSITENKEVSRTEVVLGDRLDADVALRDYNLLKVATDVYKRVPSITYTELLQAEANRRGVETEVLNREVNENFDRSLEDVEQAKLIYLLNSNLNTQETKIQPNLSKLDTFQGNFDYIVEQFPKDFGKWVIETNNNHFKLDWRGITLTNPNQSELAFESVPDYFKEDLLEYSKLSKYLNFNREFDLVYDLDSLQVERDRVINNAQALEEYKGDYVTLKNGEGIMIRNGQGQFIKLNGLVFEQVDEHNNLVFYKPLPKLNEDSLMEIEIPKPVLESNVFDYTLYQTQAKEIENLNRETNRTDYEC